MPTHRLEEVCRKTEVLFVPHVDVKSQGMEKTMVNRLIGELAELGTKKKSQLLAQSALPSHFPSSLDKQSSLFSRKGRRWGEKKAVL